MSLQIRTTAPVPDPEPDPPRRRARSAHRRQAALPSTASGRIIDRLGLAQVFRWGVLWLAVLVFIVILPANGVTSLLLGDSAITTVFGALKDAMLLGLLVAVLVTGRIRWVPVPVVVLVFMIVGLGAVGIVWTENLMQALYGWRNDFMPFLLLVIIPAILQKRHLRLVGTVFAAVAQLAALVTIWSWNQGVDWLIQLGLLPVEEGELFPTSLFVAGSNTPRGFSPYSAPNENAVTTTMVLAVIWCRPGWSWITKSLLSALPLVAIWLTQSRSGFIGVALLAVLLVGYLLYNRRPMLLWAMLTVAITGGVAVVTYYLYHDRVVSTFADPSLIGHGASFIDNLPYLLSHPFGIGTGKVGPRAQTYSSDAVLVESFFLVLAIEAGLLVMLLFMVLVGYLLVRGARAHDMQGFLTAAAVGGALVSFAVLPTLQEGPTAYTLWIVAGMGLVAMRGNDEDADAGGGLRGGSLGGGSLRSEGLVKPRGVFRR
jgi:putative inorganic carbon (HCO3(-)) transporter